MIPTHVSMIMTIGHQEIVCANIFLLVVPCLCLPSLSIINSQIYNDRLIISLICIIWACSPHGPPCGIVKKGCRSNDGEIRSLALL